MKQYVIAGTVFTLDDEIVEKLTEHKCDYWWYIMNGDNKIGVSFHKITSSPSEPVRTKEICEIRY